MKNNNLHKINNYTIQDLFKNKKLDIVAAALLLTGKLKVDSVEIFRHEPVVRVSLLGKFKSKDNGKMNNLVNFMDEHGDMTLDEIVEAFHIMTQKKG